MSNLRRVIAGLSLAVLGLMLATTSGLLLAEQYGPTPLDKAVTKKKGPKLKVDQPTYDWGTMFQGELAAHTFKLSNIGDEDLTIVEVKPG